MCHSRQFGFEIRDYKYTEWFSERYKTFFTLNYVLKRANDLKKKDFKLDRFALEERQKFEAVPRE